MELVIDIKKFYQIELLTSEIVDISRLKERYPGEIITNKITLDVYILAFNSIYANVVYYHPITNEQITRRVKNSELIEKKIFCNDGKVCKHLQFIKGKKGNLDHLVCNKYRLVPGGNKTKERVELCIKNGSFEPKKIKGDIF